MYVEGQGVSQDYVQAHMWLDLAASQLPTLGTNQRNTTVDARDRVASKMTPPQLVEAQELAFEWTIEHRLGNPSSKAAIAEYPLRRPQWHGDDGQGLSRDAA